MKLIEVLVLAGFISPVALAANGGSPYTVFGIGDLRMGSNARTAGMGYTGIGLATPNSINSFAPATWIRINRTRIEAGLLYEGFNSTDGNKSLYLARGDFNGALLAVPLATSTGLVFVAGVTPYSRVQYNFFASGERLGTDFTINHVGSGGLAKAQAGLSYSLTDYFSFGASLDYLFGSINHEQSFLLRPSLSVIGRQTETLNARGVIATVGGLFTGLDRISESLRQVSVGFVVSSRGNLKSEQQLIYEFQSSTEQDSSSITKGRLTVPVAFGLGVSYQAGDRYLVAADYFTQSWGSTEIYSVSPGVFRNSVRTGVGGERLPSKDPTAPWLDRLTYRLGAYYNATYYRVNNEPINEWALTGGLAVPVAGDTHLNVGLEYGSRGTTDKGLVKEKFFRISLSLNISEQWFTRFEED